MTDDLLHATVSARGVIVEPRGRLLVLKRASDGEWELPGGRLGSDESPREGLVRELDEETSLSVEVDEIVAANSWINDDNVDRFAVHYRCYTSERNVDLSAEHTEYEWLLPDETRSALREPQFHAVCAATGSTADTHPVLHSPSRAEH